MTPAQLTGLLRDACPATRAAPMGRLSVTAAGGEGTLRGQSLLDQDVLNDVLTRASLTSGHVDVCVMRAVDDDGDGADRWDPRTAQAPPPWAQPRARAPQPPASVVAAAAAAADAARDAEGLKPVKVRVSVELTRGDVRHAALLLTPEALFGTGALVQSVVQRAPGSRQQSLAALAALTQQRFYANWDARDGSVRDAGARASGSAMGVEGPSRSSSSAWVHLDAASAHERTAAWDGVRATGQLRLVAAAALPPLADARPPVTTRGKRKDKPAGDAPQGEGDGGGRQGSKRARQDPRDDGRDGDDGAGRDGDGGGDGGGGDGGGGDGGGGGGDGGGGGGGGGGSGSARCQCLCAHCKSGQCPTVTSQHLPYPCLCIPPGGRTKRSAAARASRGWLSDADGDGVSAADDGNDDEYGSASRGSGRRPRVARSAAGAVAASTSSAGAPSRNKRKREKKDEVEGDDGAVDDAAAAAAAASYHFFVRCVRASPYSTLAPSTTGLFQRVDMPTAGPATNVTDLLTLALPPPVPWLDKTAWNAWTRADPTLRVAPVVVANSAARAGLHHARLLAPADALQGPAGVPCGALLQLSVLPRAGGAGAAAASGGGAGAAAAGGAGAGCRRVRPADAGQCAGDPEAA
jgi:hypothetical protein